MKRAVFWLLFALGANMSFAASVPLRKRVGLLTESFGIVTDADLDEEERNATPVPFPPEQASFNYWQCFKHDGYFLGCENQGESVGEKWDIGKATFWIHANGKKTKFSTRRNWDIGFCRDMVHDILKIMEDQAVVCVSAAYGKDDKGHEFWIIDRVKTRKGEWSWFARPDNGKRPASSTGPKE